MFTDKQLLVTLNYVLGRVSMELMFLSLSTSRNGQKCPFKSTPPGSCSGQVLLCRFVLWPRVRNQVCISFGSFMGE